MQLKPNVKVVSSKVIFCLVVKVNDIHTKATNGNTKLTTKPKTHSTRRYSNNLLINTYMKVKEIIIHCSASKEGVDVTAKQVDGWHKKRGFRCIGYHYFIRLDGRIE